MHRNRPGTSIGRVSAARRPMRNGFMTIFIMVLAWIVLSLFGWSIVCVAAQADRNSSVQPMRPWARTLIVPREDARDDAACGVAGARRRHARGVGDTRVRVRV